MLYLRNYKLLVVMSCVLILFNLNSCQSIGSLGLNHKSIEPFGYSDPIIVVAEKNIIWAANNSPIDINLADAKEYCLNFRGGGFDDWRLPTIIELRELYASDLWKDSQENNSKINIYWRLWSSTIDYVNRKPHSYAVFSFHNGRRHYIHNNTSSFLRVLPVRNM